MRLSFSLSMVSFVALTIGCTPVVTAFATTGGEEECTFTLDCDGAGACAGVEYSVTCTLNVQNDIYDCSCLTDGTAGETFSEAGVCEIEGASFVNVDLADAVGHGANDCNFPISSEGAEEEEG